MERKKGEAVGELGETIVAAHEEAGELLASPSELPDTATGKTELQRFDSLFTVIRRLAVANAQNQIGEGVTTKPYILPTVEIGAATLRLAAFEPKKDSGYHITLDAFWQFPGGLRKTESIKRSDYKQPKPKQLNKKSEQKPKPAKLTADEKKRRKDERARKAELKAKLSNELNQVESSVNAYLERVVEILTPPES